MLTTCTHWRCPATRMLVSSVCAIGAAHTAAAMATSTGASAAAQARPAVTSVLTAGLAPKRSASVSRMRA